MCVADICSDKTGTITQGRMVVRKAWIPGCGTYSVETGNDVYNPTAGEVSFTSSQPKDIEEADEKRESMQPIVPTNDISNKPALQWYLNIASLANLATVEKADDTAETPGEWKARGAPTEIAIEVFASRFGWNRVDLSEGEKRQWQHVAEFPFDSDVKKMTVLFRNCETQDTHIFSKVTYPIAYVSNHYANRIEGCCRASSRDL